MVEMFELYCSRPHVTSEFRASGRQLTSNFWTTPSRTPCSHLNLRVRERVFVSYCMIHDNHGHISHNDERGEKRLPFRYSSLETNQDRVEHNERRRRIKRQHPRQATPSRSPTIWKCTHVGYQLKSMLRFLCASPRRVAHADFGDARGPKFDEAGQHLQSPSRFQSQRGDMEGIFR